MNMKKLYRELADKYGVSPEEVEKDMSNAISYAWNNPNTNNVKNCQNKVPREGEIPSNQELILYILHKLRFGGEL